LLIDENTYEQNLLIFKNKCLLKAKISDTLKTIVIEDHTQNMDTLKQIFLEKLLNNDIDIHYMTKVVSRSAMEKLIENIENTYKLITYNDLGHNN